MSKNSPHSGVVICRECNQRFPFDEWRRRKECDNPNCTCPSVSESYKLAREVIEKVQKQSRIDVKLSPVPPGIADPENPPENMFCYDVPPVMQIMVTPPNLIGGSKKRK